ncbi:type II toxin-antitoxin system RelE/ParE family toxin [bacterium]|nr:type II toxin-antitoxin system RelE/ParE family toxin [bacterium]
MIFIESKLFEKRVKNLLTPEELREFQNELIENPKKGDVIQGTGGLRKIRVKGSMKQKGKRGGSRVICLYIEFLSNMHLLFIYGKNEAIDLTTDEKKQLKKMGEILKKEAKTSQRSK